MNGNLAGTHPFKTAADPEFRDAVTEDVTHAYYEGTSRCIRGAARPSPNSPTGTATRSIHG